MVHNNIGHKVEMGIASQCFFLVKKKMPVKFLFCHFVDFFLVCKSLLTCIFFEISMACSDFSRGLLGFFRVFRLSIHVHKTKNFNERDLFSQAEFLKRTKKSIDYDFDEHNYIKTYAKKGAFKIFIGFSRAPLVFSGTIFKIFHGHTF